MCNLQTQIDLFLKENVQILGLTKCTDTAMDVLHSLSFGKELEPQKEYGRRCGVYLARGGVHWK